MTRLMLWALAFAAAAAAQCIPAAGPHITAGDIALSQPAFRALPAGQILGFAPEPGARRTFAVAELARIAARNSVSSEGLTEVCVELPRREIATSEYMEAMAGELPPGAELVILETAAGAQPTGKLVFSRAGLEPAAHDGSQLWRGHVQYAESRKAPVWARVRVTQRIAVVIAARDIPAGRAIPEELLLVQTLTLPVTSERLALRLEDVVGKVAKQSFRAGAPVVLSSLEAPAAIRRGDTIRVEVEAGATRLVFNAVAERPAREGELVDLRNPSTGKIFRARISGSKAVIRL